MFAWRLYGRPEYNNKAVISQFPLCVGFFLSYILYLKTDADKSLTNLEYTYASVCIICEFLGLSLFCMSSTQTKIPGPRAIRH
jgi:hypothetical protein